MSASVGPTGLDGRVPALLAEIVIESTDPAAAAAFWSDTLGWPLRAHQPGDVPWISQSGDPEQPDLKLVFVGARPPAEGRSAQSHRFYLRPGDQAAAEVDRLVALGANLAPTATVTPWVRLIDPGGLEFSVLPDPVQDPAR